MRGCHLQRLLVCSRVSQRLAGLRETAHREQICKASGLKFLYLLAVRMKDSKENCSGLCNEFVKGEKKGC